MYRLSSFKLVFTLLFIVVVLLPFFRLGEMPASHAVAASDTSITLDPTKTSFKVGSDFNGFSMEIANLCTLLKLDQQQPSLEQLFKNLGPGTLRIGGMTVEYTTWNPGGTPSCSWSNTVVTQSFIDNAFAFAKRVNWKVLWTVNLKSFDPVQFSNEAAYAVKSGGSALLAVEFGNEADLYHLPYSTFKANWEAYYKAFHSLSPNAPVSGPSFARVTWFPQFLNDEKSRLNLATAHWYCGRAGGGGAPRIADLLSKANMDRTVQQMTSDYNVAHAKGIPYEINETNSYYHQGQPGVSDVFASALWVGDYMFRAAEIGVVRMDFHGIPDDPNGNSRGLLNYYTPIDLDGKPAPEYYGMLMFHYAAAKGTLVNTSLNSPYNVGVHAFLGSDGHLRVIIVNKDLSNTAHVSINTTQSYAHASSISLLAPRADATTGITLGGSAIAADGSWSPTKIINVRVSGSSSSVIVPPVSAMVITYS